MRPDMNGNGHDSQKKKADTTVAQHVDRAADAARAMVDEARASGEGLMDAVDLKGRVERNPYGMVAAALGVGYVLGGGLFTPTTARILRLGMKLAAVPLVRDELLGLAESAVDGILDRTRPLVPKPPKEEDA